MNVMYKNVVIEKPVFKEAFRSFVYCLICNISSETVNNLHQVSLLMLRKTTVYTCI